MDCHLLGVLIPAVISALLLWEGVQCKKHGYSLEVSSPVTVERGLSVKISCKFTYDASHDDERAKLYGYWYVENSRRRPRLVATNNLQRIDEIDPSVRHRFEVSEPKLNRSECSLVINNAKAADQAVYHFRVEKGRRLRYSYTAAEEKLSVIVTEKTPEITFSGLLRAGHEASITCIAQRSPSSGQPTITWTGIHGRSIGKIIPHVSRIRVQSHVDFTPTASDHLQNITCKATYVRGGNHVTVERTVTLNVVYPPGKIEFSGQLTRSNGEVQYFTNISQIVGREGDSLVVHCKGDGNPESTATWRLRFPANRLYIYNNKLTLSKMASEDAGAYICEALSTEGYFEEGFKLHILHRLEDDYISARP